jgi:predicted dehydrogenase
MGLFFKTEPKPAAPAAVPEAERVPLAVIGVGHMGKHHARILAATPAAKLLGIVDRDPAAAAAAAKAHGVSAFTGIDQATGAKAAVVATPTPTHYAIVKDLLTRGLHCFVEKPLTEKVEEAEELIELARRKNLVLQVGHIERFNPAVVEMSRQAKDPMFIEASRLGPYDPRVSHVGVVLDLMIHDLDIVLALVKDKVVRLDAVGAKILSAHEDIVKVTLFFSRGCRADITASRVSLKRFRKIRVFQSDAYMSLDYSERSLKIYRKKKAEVKSLLDVSVQRPRVPKIDALETELAHFVTCVREGKEPLVSGAHGRDALELALDIIRALHLHRVGV